MSEKLARVLHQGMKGQDVKALQAQLGLVADGVFGPKTTAAVQAFQKKMNLSADGVVGAQTLAALARAAGGGVAPAPTPAPHTITEKVSGFDLSHWNGPVAYDQLRAQGNEFGICKAVDGQGGDDDTFKKNFPGVQKAGMIPGAYGWFHPKMAAKMRPQHFVDVAGKWQKGTLPFAGDVEWTDGLATLGQAGGEAAYTYLAELEQLSGKTPMIYTNVNFFKLVHAAQAMMQAPRDDHEKNFRAGIQNIARFARFPLWLSSYSHAAPAIKPWSNYTIWQYTSSLPQPGSKGKIDGNYFNGDLAALKKFAGLS